MKIFPSTVTEEEMRAQFRQWIELLAQQRYEEAVDWLSPEIPHGSGSTSQSFWVPELLESVIANYGLDEPVEGEEWRYTVAPLTDELRDIFEASMRVEFDMWDQVGPDGLRLAGAAHVDLPLIYDDGPGMSDLTAQFMFKHLSDGSKAIVLLDIHVL
jgi:hypothetical protein